MPVYQEDPEILATAIESWLRNGVFEVVLVVDASDPVCRQVAAHYPVTVIITDVPGKRDALRRGWRHAVTELVALVDSDTIWAPDVAFEVSKPFADPRIGGVGTRQSVYGAEGLPVPHHRHVPRPPLLRRERLPELPGARGVLPVRAHRRLPAAPAAGRSRHDFMNETFWGVPCLSGDDKRLTTLILERGYLTYMQRSAEVWSTFPTTWRVFFKQRLRWARNTWRSDLRALGSRWVYRHPFLAFTMMDKAISSFTLLIGPAFLAYSIARAELGVRASCWWPGGRSAARPSCCRTCAGAPARSSSSWATSWCPG